MIFNLKEFLSFSRCVIRPERGSPARLNARRIGTLAAFYAIYLPVEAVSQVSMLLDDLLFKAYRDVPVDRPLFIIGNPRSGTTFLQRLLAQDQANFSCMRLWEILLAPSILQRRLAHGLAALDRRLGRPLMRLVGKVRSMWDEENDMHGTGLLAFEEDQYLFLHIWSSLALWQFAAILNDQTRAYVRFDTAIPEQQRAEIMSFYYRAIQRHLYDHPDPAGRPKHYLSKNPSATPKIASLHKQFPNGHFIYLVRNPLDMLPSMISTLNYTWEVLGAPPDDHTSRDYILEMAKHWYTYPLAQLDGMPPSSYAIVRFDNMVEDPDGTVRDIYHHFGLSVDAAFGDALAKATERSRNYESDHVYSLSEMGLSRAQIVSDFRDVFTRFNFDTRKGAPGNAAGPEPAPETDAQPRADRGTQRHRLKPQTAQ